MIILSPHLDDAVWSAAGLCEGATVITICAGVPPGDLAPSMFDIDSGFDFAADAMEARRHEDICAAEALGFTAVHMDVKDLAYGREDSEIIEAVEWALQGVDDDEPVAGPLGISHPDHIAVSDAFRRVAHQCNLEAWLYADAPYARMYPKELHRRLEGVEPRPVGRRMPESQKREAVECYQSQVRPTTHMKEILMTEVYYRMDQNAR